MAVRRTTIGLRQDIKEYLDQVQKLYEKKLGLPDGSLSSQVFLAASSSLGVVLLDALEAARTEPLKPLDPKEMSQNAAMALERVRSDTMLFQLTISQEELKEKTSSLSGAAALVLLALGIGAMAKSRKP